MRVRFRQQAQMRGAPCESEKQHHHNRGHSQPDTKLNQKNAQMRARDGVAGQHVKVKKVLALHHAGDTGKAVE